MNHKDITDEDWVSVFYEAVKDHAKGNPAKLQMLINIIKRVAAAFPEIEV